MVGCAGVASRFDRYARALLATSRRLLLAAGEGRVGCGSKACCLLIVIGEILSTEVVMPQMGESIAEGTITKWLKKIGDHVDRDEPLFEISTDKVDAEIPSPAAGTLTEIRFKEGDTVEINTTVAVLDGGAGAPAGAPAKESLPTTE